MLNQVATRGADKQLREQKRGNGRCMLIPVRSAGVSARSCVCRLSVWQHVSERGVQDVCRLPSPSATVATTVATPSSTVATTVSSPSTPWTSPSQASTPPLLGLLAFGVDDGSGLLARSCSSLSRRRLSLGRARGKRVSVGCSRFRRWVQQVPPRQVLVVLAGSRRRMRRLLQRLAR